MKGLLRRATARLFMGGPHPPPAPAAPPDPAANRERRAARAHPKVVVERILAAKAARAPLSVTRINDGEGYILGPDVAKQNQILTVWFGDRGPGFRQRQRRRLQALVRDAVRGADIVGLPLNATKVPNQVYALDVFDQALHYAPDAVLTNANLHQAILRGGHVEAIVQDAPFVGLVGGRDVRQIFHEHYGVSTVDQYLVPDEAKFSAGTGPAERHFPTAFNRLYQQITVPYPGSIFFVGAGICGKVYCQWIKQRGGIAIDLGSIFDIWAGRVTRDFMKSFGPQIETFLAINAKHDPQAAARYARHLLDMGRADDAEPYAAKALSDAPGRPDLQLLEAEVAYWSGSRDRARMAFDALASQPAAAAGASGAHALSYLARYAQAEGRTADARALAGQAEDRAPQDEDIRVARVAVLLDQGDRTLAERLLERPLKRPHPKPDAYAHKIRLLRHQGDEAAAATLLTEAMARYPTSTQLQALSQPRDPGKAPE